MDTNELIAVYDAADEVTALLHRTLLEEAGIDVVERPWETEWFESVRQRGLHSQLLVRVTDAERARQLLAAFDRQADAGQLEATPPEQATDRTEDEG